MSLLLPFPQVGTENRVFQVQIPGTFIDGAIVFNAQNVGTHFGSLLTDADGAGKLNRGMVRIVRIDLDGNVDPDDFRRVQYLSAATSNPPVLNIFGKGGKAILDYGIKMTCYKQWEWAHSWINIEDTQDLRASVIGSIIPDEDWLQKYGMECYLDIQIQIQRTSNEQWISAWQTGKV